MSEADLMPIGRLARASRLSIKALRRYADDGLLEPAWVDPDSGYRYYARSQVREATVIALLRGLDVPLSAIRELLKASDPAAVAALLGAERERARREMEQREASVRALERLIGARDLLPYDVSLVPQPALRLGGVSGRVPTAAIGPGVGSLARSALARAETEGWSPEGGLIGVYPLDLAEEVTVAIGLPVGPDVDAVAELPAGHAATSMHVGSYEELPLAYASVLGWAHEHGHEPCGPVVETYLSDPDTTPVHELVTRVAVRVEPGG